MEMLKAPFSKSGILVQNRVVSFVKKNPKPFNQFISKSLTETQQAKNAEVLHSSVIWMKEGI